MEKKEIGRFNAITFEGKTYDFIVYNDKTIACPTLKVEDARRLLLKPRFWLYTNTYIYPIPARKGHPEELIKTYNIDDFLLQYLKRQGMIWFSTDMAYLYDFKDKDGFDKHKHNGTAFKYTKKKGKVLERWKNGKYN